MPPKFAATVPLAVHFGNETKGLDFLRRFADFPKRGRAGSILQPMERGEKETRTPDASRFARMTAFACISETGRKALCFLGFVIVSFVIFDKPMIYKNPMGRMPLSALKCRNGIKSVHFINDSNIYKVLSFLCKLSAISCF